MFCSTSCSTKVKYIFEPTGAPLRRALWFATICDRTTKPHNPGRDLVVVHHRPIRMRVVWLWSALKHKFVTGLCP